MSSKNHEKLFKMKWAVCPDGYKIAAEPPRPRPANHIPTIMDEVVYKAQHLIVPKTTTLKEVYPLQDNPALTREFSEIKQNGILDKKLLIKFVNKYGLLGVFGRYEDKAEDIELWFECVSTFFNIYEILKSEKNEHAKQSEAIDRYNKSNLNLSVSAQIAWDPNRQKRKLSVEPSTLFAAMWFLLAEELTAGLKMQACLNSTCRDWFIFRPKKQYCCTRCRVAGNRQKNL